MTKENKKKDLLLTPIQIFLFPTFLNLYQEDRFFFCSLIHKDVEIGNSNNGGLRRLQCAIHLHIVIDFRW